MDTFHLVASEMLASGLSPVPLATDGTKRPFGQWRSFQTEQPDAALVSEWTFDSGIGVILRDGVEMIEVEGRFFDTHHTAALTEAMVKGGMADVWRRIQGGWREATPSGGIHWFIRSESPSGNQKLAANSDGLVTIETRGAGGFVVTAPTRGRFSPYSDLVMWTRENGSPDNIPTLTAAERANVLFVLRSFDETPSKPIPLRPERTPLPPTEDESPGDEYARTHSWQDILCPHGWVPVFSHGEEIHWRRPGKEDGTSATTNYEGTDLLKIFSSSAHPFEAEQTYTKFGAYAILQHNGNFAAAAKYLRPSQTAPAPLRLLSALDGRTEDPETATGSVGSIREALGIMSLRDLVDTPEPEYDWLIPDLLERRERVIVVAVPGLGKSTFLRQVALRTALGQHPFTGEEIAPLKTLIVDVENSARQIRRAFARMEHVVDDRSVSLDIVCRVGLDLCEEEDVTWLDSVLRETQPDLMTIGPIYKMLSGNENDNEVARRAAKHLDLLRGAHDIAMMIETHAPYGQSGGKRQLRPQGANVWEKWPEVGITLDGDPRTPGSIVEVGRFRGDRDPRAWPAFLKRDGNPWPFEMAEPRSAVAWSHLRDILIKAGRPMNEADLAHAVGVSVASIQQAIESNQSEWDAIQDGDLDRIAQIGNGW